MALGPGRFAGVVRDVASTTAQRGFPSRSVAGIGATGFSPIHIPGLALWLDAADTDTITSSSGAVSQWNDKSGLGRHVAQATSAAQPTTGTRTLNGLNVLDFDGGDSLVSSSAASTWTFLHDGTNYVIAAVARRDVAGTNGTIAATATSAGGVGFQVRFLAANEMSHLVGNGSSSSVSNAVSVGTGTATRVVSLIASPSEPTAAQRAAMALEAGAPARNNTSTLAVATSSPGSSVSVGDRQSSAVPLDGYVAELVIVGPPGATETTRKRLVDYLMGKWAL